MMRDVIIHTAFPSGGYKLVGYSLYSVIVYDVTEAALCFLSKGEDVISLAADGSFSVYAEKNEDE